MTVRRWNIKESSNRKQKPPIKSPFSSQIVRLCCELKKTPMKPFKWQTANKPHEAAESPLTKRDYCIIDPRCHLLNTSSWVNLPTSLSVPLSMVNENLCSNHFIILYLSPPWGNNGTRDRYFHQSPLAVIISEWENGSLTYVRHVRNLQEPFVDAFGRVKLPSVWRLLWGRNLLISIYVNHTACGIL